MWNWKSLFSNFQNRAKLIYKAGSSPANKLSMNLFLLEDEYNSWQLENLIGISIFLLFGYDKKIYGTLRGEHDPQSMSSPSTMFVCRLLIQ